MGNLLEILSGFGVDTGELITIVIAVIILILRQWLGNKKVEKALEVAKTAYEAIEEAGTKKLKTIVAESIGKKDEEVKALDELLTAVVDAKKKPEAVEKKVPAIKRAWRRMLAGKNIGGILLRIAAKGV